MDKTQLIQLLMETFLVEFDERLHAMSRDVLALETTEAGTAERDKRLLDLMRQAHNLKGAARAVELSLIEKACHQLEEILSAVKKTPALLEQHLIQMIFGVLDGLAEAAKLLRKQESLEGSLLFAVSMEMEMFIETTLRPASERSGTDSAPAAQRSEKEGPSAAIPTVTTQATPHAATVAPAATRTESVSDGTAAQEVLSVRIETDKLDLLLSRSGELLAARQRLRLTSDRLAGLSESLGVLHADWRRYAKTIGQLEAAAAPHGSAGLPAKNRELWTETPQRLQALLTELDKLRLSFREEWRYLDHAGAALDQQVSRIRMLPFAHSCVGFDRMVRDLARAKGKEVELRIEGGDVELDRSILEGLKDPLRHLIRNAVDHGIEKPEDRKRVKKPARGVIVASAALRGGQVEVMVSDDGQGLAKDAIVRRAQKMNLPIPTSDQQLLDLVFAEGFSTAADAVSLVSGRGIGLDVVRTQIKALHGEVDAHSVPGKGMRFRMVVPLTLTLLRVLLVKACQQIFAVSNNYVHKLLRLRQNEVLWVGERPMILVDGLPIPLQPLGEVLALPQTPIKGWPGKRPVLVLKSEHRIAAFLVDELLAEQEVMVKSLGNRVQRLPNIAGAVILPDGYVALTLHVADLLLRQGALTSGQGSLIQKVRADGELDRKRRRILVVDDSVTTRSLEKSLLEAAGFVVELASDGVQGWERVQAGGVDLVLSDVDMPLLNGFQLTQTIRKSDQFRTLPVILITSNDDARSRERGLSAGASAYLTKGNLDQNVLMNLIEQLL
ncbi:MAG: response regulator [Myxococcales bacterium]|nr:response regulator [Myxococcales bacterium]